MVNSENFLCGFTGKYSGSGTKWRLIGILVVRALRFRSDWGAIPPEFTSKSSPIAILDMNGIGLVYAIDL
jgi:hypothetical protein